MDNCPRCQQEMEMCDVAEDAPQYAGKRVFACHNCQTIYQACEVWSRVCGYLRPVQGWNKGKQEEFKQKKDYVIGEEIKEAENENND